MASPVSACCFFKYHRLKWLSLLLANSLFRGFSSWSKIMNFLCLSFSDHSPLSSFLVLLSDRVGCQINRAADHFAYWLTKYNFFSKKYRSVQPRCQCYLVRFLFGQRRREKVVGTSLSSLHFGGIKKVDGQSFFRRNFTILFRLQGATTKTLNFLTQLQSPI